MIEAMATATRTAWRPRWALSFLAAVLAVAVGLFGAGPASAAAASAAQTRVGASHSTVGVVVGSSTGITAVQRLGNDPPRDQMVVATGVAAESAGGVRFVANSAGDVVPYVRGGTLEVTDHAALALSQRNGGIHALDDLVSSSQGFPYWHDGLWKTGCYDPASRLFAGTAEGRVTTVIQGGRVNANYINNLQAARP